MRHPSPPRVERRSAPPDARLGCFRQAVLAQMAVTLTLLSLAGCTSSRQPSENAPPTAEETAYLRQIQVTNARMSVAQNFLGHTVTILEAQVTNHGDRSIRFLELQLAFSSFSGQVDLLEKSQPINTNTPPLKPRETRSFQVSFDHVPGDWNQAPPQIAPVRVMLAEGH